MSVQIPVYRFLPNYVNVVRMPKVAYVQAADLLLRAQSYRGEQEAGQGDEEQEEEDLQPGAH